MDRPSTSFFFSTIRIIYIFIKDSLSNPPFRLTEFNLYNLNSITLQTHLQSFTLTPVCLPSIIFTSNSSYKFPSSNSVLGRQKKRISRSIIYKSQNSWYVRISIGELGRQCWVLVGICYKVDYKLVYPHHHKVMLK